MHVVSYGNLYSNSSYVQPWVCSRISQEQYYLRYESRYLVEFGGALDYILSMAASYAAQKALTYTAFSGKYACSYIACRLVTLLKLI